MPSAARFADAMSAIGVGPGTRVVTYDANMSMWGRTGLVDVAGDGLRRRRGARRWLEEVVGGGPAGIATACDLPAGQVPGAPKAGLIASKGDVLGAIDTGSACIVDALTEAQHAGASGATYCRAGHIAASVNVSARDLLDRESGAYLPTAVLRERFAAAGATGAARVITYCGGGIAATSDALVLTLLGHANVAVYDGSLSEWARDPARPMEVG